jgi:hypothetical protein
VIFVELIDRGLKGEIAPGELQLLDEVRRSGKRTRHTFLMSARPRAAARCDFPTPGGPNISRLAPFFSHASPAARACTCAFEVIRHGVEVEALSFRTASAPRLDVGRSGAALYRRVPARKRGEESCGRPAFLVGCGGKRAAAAFGAKRSASEARSGRRPVSSFPSIAAASSASQTRSCARASKPTMVLHAAFSPASASSASKALA